MRKGLVYVRVSSEDQSYERQLRELNELAKYLKIPIEKIYSEKISGSKKKEAERIEFSLMKKLAFGNKGITDLFFIELSRISRKYIEIANFIEDCNNRSICIHIKKEGLRTLNEDGTKNSSISVVLAVLSSLAESEASVISSRVKSGKRHRATLGLGLSQKVFGYTKDEQGYTIIDEDQAEVVKTVFKLVASGQGCRKASEYLNGNNLGGKDNWRPSSLHSMIRNTIHKGKRKYKDFEVDVPPIVSDEQWNKANFEIDSRKHFSGNKSTNINLVQGFIKCKYCGKTMVQIVNPTARTNQYRCETKGCKSKNVNRFWLYDEIRKLVEKYSSLKNDREARERMLNRIELNSGILNQKKKKLARLKERIKRIGELYIDSELSKTEYTEMKGDVINSIARIEKTIDETNKENSSLEKTLGGTITYFSSNEVVFKEQLKEVLEYIIVDNHFVEIKVIGFFKYLIPIPTGAQLYRINRAKKGLKNTPGKDTKEYKDFYKDFDEEKHLKEQAEWDEDEPEQEGERVF